jgi:LCP family protein required for cell wall assembly
MTMNPFEKKAISSHHPLDTLEQKTTQAEKWVKSHLFLSLVMLILGVLTLKGVVGAIRTGHPFSMKQIFISAIGSGLETDDYGHTNILLLGVGGEGHDGANLTDTMMVASIDDADGTVSLLSVPRDLYIAESDVGWGTRINSIYQYIYDEDEDSVAAEASLEKEMEELLGIDIQYYAKIDFKGFVEIVDAIGGITVTVPETINDESYPATDGSLELYDPFYLTAGEQELDGETALKYARSRHSTAGGDFDRAKRQQQVIEAIKDKALSLGVLANPSKIKNIYYAISSNFETNLSLSNMLTLVDQSGDFEDDSIASAVFSDAAYQTGGFLYTPEREEGDPFYLEPYTGDFSELQQFAQLFFYHPNVVQDQIPVMVLNGTKEESMAGLTKMMLVRYGFNAVYGNAPDKNIADTMIYNLSPKDDAVNETIEVLPSLTYGEISEDVPPEVVTAAEGAKIVIVLGQDFAEYYRDHDNLFYIGFY